MKVIDLRKETAVPKHLTLVTIPEFAALAKRVSDEIASDFRCGGFLILCGNADTARSLADFFWFGIDLHGIPRSGEIIAGDMIVFASSVYSP